MKKYIICLTITLIMVAVQSFAVTERQGNGLLLTRDVPIQGFSPNGDYTSITSNNATFHNLTSFLAFSFYCPSDCSMRLSATASKGTYKKVTMPGGAWHTFVKNSATPFVNISSAANAAHEWLQQ